MNKKTLLSFWLLLLCMIVGGASSAWGVTYQHIFTAKPSTGNSITLSSINWNIEATNLGSYNSGNYAGVQIGTSSKNGSITLTSSNNWGAQNNTTPYGYTKVKEVRLWLNLGGTSVTPTVTIGGKSATSDGTTVVKNSSAGSDYKKATKVTFTPASDGKTGQVVISVSSLKAGYICAIEIDSELPTVDLTDSEFAWSSSSATATIGAANTFPTLTNTKGVTVSYQSTNEDVATINSSTGAISLVAAGETTIKAVFAGNSTYNAKTVTYDLTVLAAGSVTPPSFTEDDGASVELGSTLTINAAEGYTLKYQIGNGDITSVNSNTKDLTMNTVGAVTINAWAVDGDNESDEASISLTVTKHPISLSFSPSSVSVVRGETVSAPTLTGNTGSGTVTYGSGDENVATVNSTTGVVTGVKVGSATITATVDATSEYLGNTATFTVTVTKPYHTVTFSVNGNTTRTASIQEDVAISFPTAVEDPGEDKTKIPEEINGQVFVGWYGSTYTHASTAPSYVSTSTTTMGTSDVTYYAVYADMEEGESDDLKDCVLAQTLQYDTWTYSGNTTDKTSYRLFGNNAYIQSASFDLSKLMKVNVYGGTFGGSEYDDFTIGDGSNTWKTGSFADNKETTKNELTGGTALSGNKSLRVISNSGDGSSNGLRISKVEIFVKGTTTTYSNFNTTVSALPRPVITMEDVEMTWGDSDKSVAPTATVSGEAYEGTFTFESLDGNLTVDSDGKLSSNVPGSYTVTASIAATKDYQAASTTCTVTVNKKNISLSFANTEIVKMVTDETKTFTETATPDPAAYDGTISYAISGSGSATINTSTAQVTYTASTGVNTITATAPATDKYNGNSASYTLYVKTTPTITVSNQTLAYGETYEPSVTGGDVAITAVPNLITVDGGVITAAVVGTATVTVSTAANDTYVAGEETFILTVTAPTALSAKPTPSPVTVFYESFDTSTGTGGNDGSWNGSIASSDFAADNTWTTTNAKGAKACAKFGTGDNGGSATTPNIGLEKDVVYTLTFKAGAWDGKSEGTSLSLSASNATIKNEANTDPVSSVTTSKGGWTSYTLKVIVTDESDPANITFSTSGGNNRFFLDEVKLTKLGTPITTVPVTVSTSGYATYCCLYPLDLDELDSKVKAYTVTAVTSSSVTFTKITGKIKGGVPIILYGEAGDYNLTVADESSTVPAGNNLSGTLAPTYLTQINGDYTNFALSASNGDFRLIPSSGMTFPANKAYLPVLTSVISGGSARLAIIFDDDQTTTIQGVSVRKVAPDTYYNMKGQRVDNPKKGGVYVKNGKKVIFK